MLLSTIILSRVFCVTVLKIEIPYPALSIYAYVVKCRVNLGNVMSSNSSGVVAVATTNICPKGMPGIVSSAAATEAERLCVLLLTISV